MKVQFSKLTLIALLLLSSFSVMAQKKQFFDENFDKCKEKKAYYYRIVTQEGSQYIVKDYFYSNNQIQMEGAYTNKKLTHDSRNGNFKFYYKNGQKSYEGDYVGGLNDGEWSYYYNNGQLKAKGTFDKDNKEGEWEYYHKNSQLRGKIMYKNGDIEGPYNYFYDDGSKHIEANYEKGKKNGAYTFYYPKINKVSVKKNFLKDSIDGTYEHYFKDGTLAEKGTYSDNKMNGLFEFYHKNSNKSCEAEYKKGKFIKATYFDEDGKKLSKKILEDDLIKSAEYTGGVDEMYQLVFKKLWDKADMNGAKKVKFNKYFLIKLTLDAEGNVTENEWVIPDSDDDTFEDDYGIKKFIEVAIESFPKFQPAKHYNRFVETTYYLWVPVDFSK